MIQSHKDSTVRDPARGMTGTTPADVYKPSHDAEQMTSPPDHRPMDAQPQWRKDFPIDWPQDHYVARRDFAKFLVLTSAAFSVGQFWIGVQNYFRRRRGTPAVVRLAAVDSVPVGGVLQFNYPGPHDPCVLARLSEELFVAYSQKCTHLACAVIPKPDAGVIHCPCHEGYFEITTGRPIAGPPQRPLPSILLEIRNGHIYATGVELRTV